MTEFAGSDEEAHWLEQDFLFDTKSNVWSLKANPKDFAYSDGDKNEEYLLSVMRRAESCAVMSDELTKAMKDWPSTYHLHFQRSNLFRPFTDLIKGPVLEIGAGCGAITRFLGEQGQKVFAVEGSARRASIIGERCRDLSNVSIINANFQDLKTTRKFQTITLIGVLEYARVYFQDGSAVDPIDRMLRQVADMLTEDGVLFVAIENQLGLKYLAGFPEDHLGIAMSGVEEHYTSDSVVTFGKSELSERLSNAGLHHASFAYPFPDYKLPELVMSETALSGPHAERYAALVAGSLAADRQHPGRLNFRMSKAIGPLLRNGLGPDLANSFLVMASKSDNAFQREAKPEATYFGNGDRKKPYLKTVEFFRNNDSINVTRHPLVDAKPSESASFIQVLEDEAFVEGTLWGQKLQDILARKKWTLEDIEPWARTWFDALKENAGVSDNADEETMLDGKWLDAVPKNLIIHADGKGSFVDLEWESKTEVKLGYILTRGLADSLASVEAAAYSYAPKEITSIIVDLCIRLGVPMTRSKILAFLHAEGALQKEISNAPGSGTKIRFVRTNIPHSFVQRLDWVFRGGRRVLYMLSHPLRAFFKPRSH